jgi:hypothetical protein
MEFSKMHGTTLGGPLIPQQQNTLPNTTSNPQKKKEKKEK